MIFVELNENQLLEIDGGIAASAVFAIAGGTCEVAAGVCLLLP